HAARIERGLVGVVADAVIAGPLHGDVPVAIAEVAGDDGAARRRRVLLPRGEAHELVLAPRVAGRADDFGRALAARLREPWVDRGEERRRAVAHDDDVVGAAGAVILALAELARALHELRLHLVDLVLARQHEVDAVPAHQAAGGRLRAAVRD